MPTNVIAAILSFFIPGFGQLVERRTQAAMLFFGGWIISAILCVAIVGFVLTPVVWIWSVIDAALWKESV